MTHLPGSLTITRIASHSDVQLPIAVQRSSLNLSFPEKNTQSRSHKVRSLSKLFCQIPLADHNIPGWKAVVNFAAIERDFIRDSSELFFFLSPGTFSSCLACFEAARAGDNGNSKTTRDHGAHSAVQDKPSGNSGKEVHNSNALNSLIGTSQG
jgi:hypothetical protein